MRVSWPRSHSALLFNLSVRFNGRLGHSILPTLFVVLGKFPCLSSSRHFTLVDVGVLYTVTDNTMPRDFRPHLPFAKHTERPGLSAACYFSISEGIDMELFSYDSTKVVSSTYIGSVGEGLFAWAAAFDGIAATDASATDGTSTPTLTSNDATHRSLTTTSTQSKTSSSSSSRICPTAISRLPQCGVSHQALGSNLATANPFQHHTGKIR